MLRDCVVAWVRSRCHVFKWCWILCWRGQRSLEVRSLRMCENARSTIATSRKISARNHPRDFRRGKVSCSVRGDITWHMRRGIIGATIADSGKRRVDSRVVRVTFGRGRIEAFCKIFCAVDWVSRWRWGVGWGHPRLGIVQQVEDDGV